MKILLGVTASVAATLTPKLVSSLSAESWVVKMIATERSLYFFDRNDLPSEVELLSDRDEWPGNGYTKDQPIPHIDLGAWADILLIAPLTADTLSDIAHGKANKFLTSTVLAWPLAKPLVIAPAMNTRMWENPITQDNLDRALEVYNTIVVDPIAGKLACGTEGIGAMARIEDIIKIVKRSFCAC